MDGGERVKPKRSRLIPLLEFILFIVLIALDQITKQAAASALKGNAPYVLIEGVLEFYYLENTGAAFSMLENAQWLFALIAIAAVVFITWLLARIPEKKHYAPLSLCLVFIAAGAVGNLIDRLTLHYVRDFIYFVLINFPVFNVADIYVTVATFFLIILVLFVYRDDDFAFLKKHREGEES